MGVPRSFIAGDSYAWGVSLSSYKASDGWALTYLLVNQDSHETITSQASGDDFAVTVSAEQTGGWSPGPYTLFTRVSKGAEATTLRKRLVTVAPNPAAGAADHRTHAMIMLDAIIAMLERRATVDQQSYTIDGNLLTRYSWDELDKLRQRYARLVRADEIRLGKRPARRRKARIRLT